MHHVHHSSVTKNFQVLIASWFLLPQSEKWLVLEGLIHPPEYIKPGSIGGETK